MNHWLVKSEPSAYSWGQFIKDKRTCWSGVRNFAARKNLRGLKQGDLVLFYHSGGFLRRHQFADPFERLRQPRHDIFLADGFEQFGLLQHFHRLGAQIQKNQRHLSFPAFLIQLL